MKIRRRHIARLSDAELVELWASSDRGEYFGELYARYTPLVYGVCLKYTGGCEAAAECVRALMRELAETPSEQKEKIKEFGAWLHGQSAEYAQSFAQGAGKPAGSPARSQNLKKNEAAYLIKLGEGEKEAVEAFDKGKGALSKPQRECIESFLINKMAYEDIAERKGYLIGDVRGYIESGIKSLVAQKKTSTSK